MAKQQRRAVFRAGGSETACRGATTIEYLFLLVAIVVGLAFLVPSVIGLF